MISEKQKFCVTFWLLISTPVIHSVFNKQQIRGIKSTTVYRSSNPDPEPSLNQEVLIHSFSTYAMIWTTLILWYLHVNDVQNEKQAKSERLTLNLERAWSFELLPLDVLESARVTEEKMPSSLIQREEQRFGFLFGKSGFLWRVSQVSFSLLIVLSFQKPAPWTCDGAKYL